MEFYILCKPIIINPIRTTCRETSQKCLSRILKIKQNDCYKLGF